ncbi:MAG: Sua5/YciO/YrdC/YwlC family protein, partial [Bacteroidales bacterium]|nr:Sua5/YciO/YrdC/YwlC family protein [Bacteroidales bacterium]
QIAEAMQKPLLITSVPHEEIEEDEFTNGSLLEEKYRNEVEMIIESDVPSHNPSTVIDFTEEEPQIIRQGISNLVL